LKRHQTFFIPILLAVVISFLATENAYGHGMTSEFLQGQTLSGQGISLNLYSTTSPTEKNHREIYFESLDSETRELINQTTFLVKVFSTNEKIFEDSFQVDNGILILDFDLDDESFSKIDSRESGLEDPDNLKNAKMQNIPNLLNSEISGGLYDFEIQILTAGNYDEYLDEPIVFESGLSFPSSEFFEINTPNYGLQQFGLIGYYDKPYDFDYNFESREITFSMAYSWPEHKKEDQFFVHNEILIPKSFGDLRYENYSAYINGIDQTDKVFSIDFALDDVLQVHLVTQWEQFEELSDKLKDENDNLPPILEYTFVPTDPDAPYSSVTNGGRYRINLDWEPENIVAGSKTNFSIEILDIFTKNQPKPTDYHFTVIHGDEEIFHKSDLSTDPNTKTTELEFDIPEDISGPIIIRFENLGGGIFSNLDFPAIVYSSDLHEIPNWIKNNAGWWAEGSIDDDSFVQGIQYLIKEDILKVPPTSQGSVSSNKIPNWIKNNAGWWAEGSIDDKSFLQGIEYLIQQGILTIN